MCCCVWRGRNSTAQSMLEYAKCSLVTRGNKWSPSWLELLRLYTEWLSKLLSACLICSRYHRYAVSLPLFRQSVPLPWVVGMKSWRGGWDKLSMAATLVLKPFKVFAQIPSISCIFYLPFQVSCILAQGICATWWPIPVQWESMALQLSWSKQSGNEISHGFDPYRSQLTPFCPINPCQLP